MEIIETNKTLVSLVGNFPNAIEFNIIGNKIELRINQNNLFSILENRKELVGYLNKKIEELLQEHLKTMSKKEQEKNKDL